jgi:hypothetical protein
LNFSSFALAEITCLTCPLLPRFKKHCRVSAEKSRANQPWWRWTRLQTEEISSWAPRWWFFRGIYTYFDQQFENNILYHQNNMVQLIYLFCIDDYFCSMFSTKSDVEFWKWNRQTKLKYFFHWPENQMSFGYFWNFNLVVNL